MEFLQGRMLGNNLINLGMLDEAHGVLAELGCDFSEILRN